MTTSERAIRVRYAPSPTGYQHVGGIRTVIFDWLWARHTGGTFILRIEDTDRKRFKEGALEDLFASLEWLGLDYDEGPNKGGDFGPYFQSERLSLYHEYASRLIELGGAYECYCAPRREEEESDEGDEPPPAPAGRRDPCRDLSEDERARERATCATEGRRPVVRLKTPLEGRTAVRDLSRGEIVFENKTIPDYILLKSDGFPTYHLANVVDDHFMEISHILRGDEWIPTAPMHVIMYRFFGWEPPIYAHVPMVLDPSGKGKLSKRKQVGADGQAVENLTMVREFRAAGYLPEALFNFLATLGWALSGDQEVFSREEAVAAFELEDIKKSPARFEYEKLEWMNGVYIRALDPAELAARVLPFMHEAGLSVTLEQILPLVTSIQERIKTLREAVDMLDFFFSEIRTPPLEELVAKKMTPESTREALQAARARLSAIEWSEPALEASLRASADELGLKAGALFTPIRLAVTGKRVSPPLFETLYHLGRDRSLGRLDRTIAALAEAAEGHPVGQG
ncbi:MAG TPA: glutamate--tRNA ligase [Ardenticatenaceae bacterium]|nr:glutamate--tRNA ligase [Ardenticatenaceae bacterium]